MYNDSSAKLNLNFHNKYKRPRENLFVDRVRFVLLECYHSIHCDGY